MLEIKQGALMETSWGWNLAIVISTLLGPILAVQAQKLLDARRELQRRQLFLFHALMRNRAAPVAPDFVNALNSVPLEFGGSTTDLEKIRSAWRQYMRHMDKPTEAPDWGGRRVELLVGLLKLMGSHLKYKFDEVELEHEVYAPRAHGELENDQTVIRQGLAALLSGQRSLPLDVRAWPTDEQSAARQQALQDALLAWLKGDAAPQVRVADAGKAPA